MFLHHGRNLRYFWRSDDLLDVPYFPVREIILLPPGNSGKKLLENIGALGGKVANLLDAVRTTKPELMKGGTVSWHGLFSAAELDRLERHCDSLSLEQARVTGDGYSSIRTTKVAWVHRNAEATENLYQ